MIVISLLLVLAAGVLLGFGLVFLDEPLLYSSIGVSALAALALVVGVRRLAALRAGRGIITVRPAGATLGVATGRATPRPIGRATPRPVGRAAVSGPAAPVGAEDPAAEPAESLSERDAARVATLAGEVFVVDGLPRYHLAACRHAGDPESEALPVAEAVELGFTPCGRCRPASSLLRDADGG